MSSHSSDLPDTSAGYIKMNADYTRISSLVIPFPIQKIWPHLDDYLKLQEFLHEDQKDVTDLKLEDANTIVFTWGGDTVRERLVEHDPQTLRWTIIVPGGTNIFERYRASVQFVPITDGNETLAQLTMTMRLKDNSKADFIFGQMVDPLFNQRLPKFLQYIYKANGVEMLLLSTDMEVPIEKLWEVISNWKDVTWVLGAESTELDEKDMFKRSVKMAGRDDPLVERLTMKDDNTHSLQYHLLSSSFPVKDYRGNIKLVSKGDKLTEFRYTVMVVPKPEVDFAAVKGAVVDRLTKGAEHIKGLFKA